MIVWLLRLFGYIEYEPYEMYDIVQNLDPDARYILVRVGTEPGTQVPEGGDG